LSIAYCLLPIACCLLYIAYCLLAISYCLLCVGWASVLRLNEVTRINRNSPFEVMYRVNCKMRMSCLRSDPSPMQDVDYGSQDYWEMFYASGRSIEWLVSYSDIKHILRPLLPAEGHILELGCGNSCLAPDMVADGFNDVTAADYSACVISTMRGLHPQVCCAFGYSTCDNSWARLLRSIGKRWTAQICKHLKKILLMH
jgi:hypothetical protein